jgi:hypothetical protein
MDEISNKTLATLLVVAIVISLAGTFFAMRGVSEITNVITGAQVATGTAKVNITETVDVTLDNPTVDFGEGYRNVTYLNDVTECNLTSGVAKPDCWILSSGTYDPADFWLENTGNVAVNVTINSTASASVFNACDGSSQIVSGDAAYYWDGKNTTATDNADTFEGCQEVLTDLVKVENTFDGSPELICTNLSSADDKDEFNITIRIDVPNGPTGQCDNNVVFTAARNY